MINETIKLGNRKLKTRIVMPPVATYQCLDDGSVTDVMLEYYSARAANPNVGMIITEHSYFTMQGKAKPKQLSIASDNDIEGLSRLVGSIHKYDKPALCQLNHAGAATFHDVTGTELVSSSPVILPTDPMMGDGTVPKALSKDEIKIITEEYAKAAKRAEKAGYDGVEIHSAHSYLLNQFYSPLTNRRDDEYGGELENRMRFHKEVIGAVRAATGKGFIISVRFGGCDYMDGGSTIEDAAKGAKILESCGIDMLSLSGGMCRYIRAGHDEPGYFKDMSFAIKDAVGIPVLLTGGIKTLSEADALLNEKAADMIGVGRELLKNAAWESASAMTEVR